MPPCLQLRLRYLYWRLKVGLCKIFRDFSVFILLFSYFPNRMIELRIKFIFLVGAMPFLLNGCDSDRIYDIEPMPEEVSSVKDIPNCTQKYSGEQIYVVELGKTLVCDDKKWKDTSGVESSSSKKSGSSTKNGESIERDWEYLDHYIDGGTLTDSRDNQKYSTVIINGKRWMAENLRYDSKSEGIDTACFKGEKENCKTMGFMYDYGVKGIPRIIRDDLWESVNIFNYNVFPPKENICPEGWRLPYSDEWKSVVDAARDLITTDVLNYSLSALLDSSWNLYKDTVIIAGTNRLGFNVKGNPVKLNKEKQGYTVNVKADSIPFWYTLYSPYTFDVSKTSQKSRFIINPSYYSFIDEDPNAWTYYAFVRCVEKDDNDKYEIKSSTMTDNRYDDVYKILKIGKQWWMAEDLRFKDNPDDCNPYTTNECLYTYNQAMEYPKPNYICPEGWRLPTTLDWFNMFFYVDMSNGRKKAIESVVLTNDSTGIIPSETGLDLKNWESYFTSTKGSESIGLSSIPFQYIVSISSDSFYFGQVFLRNNYASRVRCVKDVQAEE